MTQKYYLYGIVNTPGIDVVNAPGVTGSPPFLIKEGNFGAVASICSGEKFEVNFDNLSKHNQVLNEILEHHDIIPFSFNTIMDSEADVHRFIQLNQNPIKSNFDRIMNKIEMGIKAAWNSAKIKQEIIQSNDNHSLNLNNNTPASAYIKQKYKDYALENNLLKKAGLIKEYILEKLSGSFVDVKDRLMQTDNIAFNGSFLIDRTKKNDFIRTFEEIKQENKHLFFLMSGPWAPYNFIDIDIKEEA